MLQTICVYILLLVLMLISFKKVSKTNKLRYAIGGILAYALMAGLRYGVGVDFFNYLEYYEYFRKSGIPLVNHEIGFQYLTNLIASLDLHYSYYFGIIAFLQIFLITLVIKDDKKIFPYIAYTFVLGCIWLSYCNGLRQIIAFCIWALSIQFIVKKKILLHYILILLAFTFHSSALLLIIFYPIFQKRQEWFANIKIQLLLLIISLGMMMTNYIQNFISMIEHILILSGYESYTRDYYSNMVMSESLSIGIGFFLTLTINIIIICQNNNIKKWLNNIFFTIIYNLYFIGVLIKYAFISSQLVNRLNYYFLGFDYIIASYCMYYFYKQNRRFFYILIILYIFLFIGTMYRMEENTSLYIFNFQQEFFHEKNSLLNH